MSSNENKLAIEALCKLLNKLYGTSLKADIFRLAKFNKTENNVVQIFWQLLSSFVGSKPEIYQWLKLNQYPRIRYFEPGNNPNFESRELLYAVAFTVSKKLEQRIQEKIECSPFGGNSVSFLNLLSGENIAKKLTIPILSEENTKKFIKFLQGKIENNINLADEYVSQSRKVYEKLKQNLNARTDKNFTEYETLALLNSTYSKQFIKDSEPILELLEEYSGWLKKEKTFWKWMENGKDSYE